MNEKIEKLNGLAQKFVQNESKKSQNLKLMEELSICMKEKEHFESQLKESRVQNEKLQALVHALNQEISQVQESSPQTSDQLKKVLGKLVKKTLKKLEPLIPDNKLSETDGKKIFEILQQLIMLLSYLLFMFFFFFLFLFY